MTITGTNLKDLAEVLRALAESGLWHPDRDEHPALPDPRYDGVPALAVALEDARGEDLYLVDTEAVHQWGTIEAASPLDAEAAAALLADAGARGSRSGRDAHLIVGESVPGGVWVTAHAIHGDVRNLSGDKQYADALARLVRDHWERARPAFVDDVKDEAVRVVTDYLEALPEVIEDLDNLAHNLIEDHRLTIESVCVLSEFGKGLERGDGRGIDVETGEFQVDAQGEIHYRDWDEVVDRVADAEAAEIIRKWEASRK